MSGTDEDVRHCNACGWDGTADEMRDTGPGAPDLCPDCLSTDVEGVA